MENLYSKPENITNIKSNFEDIDSYFKQGKLLHHNISNDWASLWNVFLDEDQKALGELAPMLHYEDYYRKNYETAHANRIMELSDQKQIEKHDALIDEFNKDLPRIKEEKDFNKLQDFYDQAIETIEECKK